LVAGFTSVRLGHLRAALRARREAAQARRRPVDRCRDQVVLQARVALGRAAHSSRPECRTCGRDCGRQDRRVTPVGFRSVPVSWSGGRVFADGRDEWWSGQAGGAWAGGEL